MKNCTSFFPPFPCLLFRGVGAYRSPFPPLLPSSPRKGEGTDWVIFRGAPSKDCIGRREKNLSFKGGRKGEKKIVASSMHRFDFHLFSLPPMCVCVRERERKEGKLRPPHKQPVIFLSPQRAYVCVCCHPLLLLFRPIFSPFFFFFAVIP